MSAPTVQRPGSQPDGPDTRPRVSPPPPSSAPNPSIGIGPTFLAAAAILTGASALGTPISGNSWVLPLVEVVAVIWLVGIGGRLIRLPTAVTALLQLVGFAIALTSLFTTTGIGGVLPNASAVSEAGALLSGAWDQILKTSPPAPSTPELSFLIALAIGCAAFIADFLVAEAKSPALVALPLLCLYSVPASISNTMLSWYSFAAPAVLYAVLLAVTGHRDRRTGVRAGVGLAVNGGAIIALATVVALFVAGSVSGIGTTGRLPKSSASSGAIGLSPLASLRGNLRTSDPVDVLTASGLTGPDYFRTVSLTTWTPNQGWSLGALDADVSDVSAEPLDSTGAVTDKRVTVTTKDYQDRFLPILTGTSSISGLGDIWNFDSTLDTVFRGDRVKPGQYVLAVDQKKPTDVDLEADSVVSGGSLTETGSLNASVIEQARQVTQSETGAFDKARALEQWFTTPANGFVYSLDVPVGSSGDALVDFLTNKQGFCEQYASAMAIMLRSLNIPTRVVVGFTQGVRQADGTYLVTSHDAHAWVEVKFETNGWIRFDPTPPVGGQGGQQGYQDSGSTGASTSSSSAVAPPATVSGRTRAPEGATTTRPTASSAVATQVDVASGAGGAGASWIEVVLIVLIALALITGLVLIPTAIRTRRRRHRLSVAAHGGPGAATAAWAEIEDTAIDHGILPHSAESARVTANRLARRAHLEDADRVRLRALVMAAELEWYGQDHSDDGGPLSTAGTAGEVAVAGNGGLAPNGAASGNGASSGNGAAAGSTTTLDRPGSAAINGHDLVAGAKSIIEGLQRNAPTRPTERLYPRSLRRSGR
ncbi:transglutaminase-like putative cysteine protease [Nakamurella sp. UYEF19]|uniref:transglutaminase family protein n=1 Tax=Nakamurella sp. UYEF19 TaxID=1756392 RepID=UPI003391A3AF